MDHDDDHDDDDDDDGRRQNHPKSFGCCCARITACGYKSIYIPKSQLSFPAWLLVFSGSSGSSRDNNNKTITTTTTTCNKRGTTTTVGPSSSYYWRSKRDFLRLSRVVSKHNPKLCFPRAAFRKLSDQAPWMRLDSNPYVDDDDRHSIHGVIPIIASENQWKPFMKKSLFQLDHYLQQVVQQVIVVEEETRKKNNNNNKTDDEDENNNKILLLKAWNEFCRPYDCSLACGGVEQDREMMDNNNNNPDNHEYNTINTNTTPDDGAIQKKEGMDHPAPVASIGNALGQYFCHVQIAQQLIRCCLDKLLLRQQQQEQASSSRKPIVFVEPSCGHGQVIETLLEILDQEDHYKCGFYINHHPSRRLRVLGIDLDQTAVVHSSNKFAKRGNLEDDNSNDDKKMISYGSSGNGDDNICRDNQQQQQQQEQQQQQQQGPPDVNTAQKKTESSSMPGTTLPPKTTTTIPNPLGSASTTATPTVRIPVKCVTANFLYSRRTDTIEEAEDVVILGGPPYTSGAGKRRSVPQRNNNDEAREDDDDGNKADEGKRPCLASQEYDDEEGQLYRNDLPLHFVRHALVEYRAIVVAFIMPQRCAKVPYHEILQMDRSTTTMNNNETYYDYETIALDGPSIFYFQGQHEQAVHQPSIIQVFWRRQDRKQAKT